MQNSVLFGLLALALSGCASIFSGTTQDVAIRSTPGAKFVVTNSFGNQVASGNVGDNALAQMNLTRGAGYFSPHSYKVQLSKPGFRPATVSIDPGMNGWYFANIALGGFIGMVIVDPLTGAMYRLVPEREEALLLPAGEEVSKAGAEKSFAVRSRDNRTSRHDYSARLALAKLNCTPEGNPDVTGLNTHEEWLLFNCKEGRQQVVLCRSDDGCSGS